MAIDDMVHIELSKDLMSSFISCSSPKRRVRFAETASVRPIETYRDLSGDELQNTWYQKYEFDEIKRSLIPLIKGMTRGDFIEETRETTLRGLEYRTRQGALRRQHNKVISITSVLDEQDRQRCSRCFDAEAIRNIYLQNSEHCSLLARQLAITDEELVKQFALEDALCVVSSSQDAEDLIMGPMSAESKLVGVNRLVKKFRRKHHSLYEEITDLSWHQQLQGLPQAA